MRSGDLIAIPDPGGDQDLLRIDRSSDQRWAVAGGSRGGPLASRNAWALSGLDSGDDTLAQHCLGCSTVAKRRPGFGRDWLASCSMLAPRLRRRATLNIVHAPTALFVELEHDASLALTGASAARLYGWTEPSQAQPEAQVQSAAAWALDAYVPQAALDVLLDQVPRCLPAAELIQRVCAALECSHHAHLAISDHAA